MTRWTARWRGDLAEAPEQFLLPAREYPQRARRGSMRCRSKPCRCCMSRSQQTVVGYMTEAYALKRYTAELERMRSAELGQRDLFSIGPLPNSKTSAPLILFFTRGSATPYIRLMRPETQRSVEDIQQAIALLRRHL